MFKFKVDGLKQLNKKLKALGPKLEKKVVRQALRAGAKIILADAKRNVPVKSGALKKDVRIKTMKRKKGRVGIIIQTGYGETWYGRLIELGWKLKKGRSVKRAESRLNRLKRPIKGLHGAAASAHAKKNAAEIALATKSVESAKSGKNKNTVEGRHYLKNAFDSKHQRAAAVITDKIREGIEREAAK